MEYRDYGHQRLWYFLMGDILHTVTLQDNAGLETMLPTESIRAAVEEAVKRVVGPEERVQVAKVEVTVERGHFVQVVVTCDTTLIALGKS